jgi:hypothetical protein
LETLMAMPKQKPGKSKQDYETPQEFLDAVQARLGIWKFTFDFACSKANCKGDRGWTEQDNSLSKREDTWARAVGDGWGWLNPPFSQIGPWAARCLGSGARIAFLVPASVGSNWYRDFIHGQHGVTVFFLNGRISFDGKDPYPKDCMLVLFGGDQPFSTSVWTWSV